MSGYIGNIPIPQATQTRDSFTATASQTSFATGGYTPNFLDVYLNGLKLNSSQFTATNGTDVVLTSAASANDIVEVIAYTAFEVADASFDELSIGGDLTVGGTVDGRDIAADGTKLDGIESGATGDQTNAEIRAAVEAAPDSNVFTDADHTKLNAIEANATADQTKADIEGLGIDVPATNLTGTIPAARLSTATTQAESDDSTKIATTAYVVDKITTLIGGAPSTLNDLNELAAAINDDANYNTTLTTALATKLPLSGGALTGAVTTNSTFDGRDIAADGSKLDAIEASADVTDTANVVSALTAGSNITIASDGTISGSASYTHPNHTGEITSSGDGATTIASNVVDADNLKVTGNGSNTQFLRSDGDGTFTWAVPTDTNTTYSVGDGGLTQKNFTTTLKSKLDGIATSANNYSFPYTVSDSASNSTVVQRNSSGYIYADYIHTTDNVVTSGITDIVVKTSNDFHRSASAATVRSFLNVADGATNVTNNNQLTNGAGYITSYTDTNTTYSGGTNITLSGTTFNLDTNVALTSLITTGGTAITFKQSTTTKGSISVNSTGTTYNTTSDRRLKDNIKPIVDATDKLMSMKPVTHTWIADPEAPSVHGFIAQEMQEVLPEAVSGEDGGAEMMSMDYGRITPVLVSALQEAIIEIKKLKTQIDKLENN